MRERGLEAVSDAGALEAIVDGVITANEVTVAKIRGGDDRPLNALMGQVMKQTQGKADPVEVRKLLSSRLHGS